MKEIRNMKIAVVGVSENTDKFGYRIFADLLKAGFEVSGVNVKGGTVLSRPVYKSLGDLPAIPDLVITVVPPKVTEKTVDDCIELGIREIWMQPGSGSEAAVERAKNAGLEVTRDACIMVEAGIW